MRIIDLYSGVSGWHTGFKTAGLEILTSYEWWQPANYTHNTNFGTNHSEVNIRELKLDDLPKDIDVVIGSPPCTEFSFSNRGGNGNIADGLVDITKFLEVVEFLKPKYWIMENVPRVASILREEIQEGQSLERFAHLIKHIVVVNTEEYGLPQSRKRMLAGVFPLELLESYKPYTNKSTLGDVINALHQNTVVDPIYGIVLDSNQLTDNDIESPLDKEEVRMNKEAKTFHPVYNGMSFPDNLSKPSRTITGTSTRVSRESIIIEDPRNQGVYRRLTLRESATLQGFPITFQFYGNTYTDKLKMIGNAFPAVLAYYIANCLLGTAPEHLRFPNECEYKHPTPTILPQKTLYTTIKKSYSERRRFCAAIPNLRFGSGVRFELANAFEDIEKEKITKWKVSFYRGTSKQIHSIELGSSLFAKVHNGYLMDSQKKVLSIYTEKMNAVLHTSTAEDVQLVWRQKSNSPIHPFTIVDILGSLAYDLSNCIKLADTTKIEDWVRDILLNSNNSDCMVRFTAKDKQHAFWFYIGFIVGSWFNITFPQITNYTHEPITINSPIITDDTEEAI